MLTDNVWVFAGCCGGRNRGAGAEGKEVRGQMIFSGGRMIQVSWKGARGQQNEKGIDNRSRQLYWNLF